MCIQSLEKMHTRGKKNSSQIQYGYKKTKNFKYVEKVFKICTKKVISKNVLSKSVLELNFAPLKGSAFLIFFLKNQIRCTLMWSPDRKRAKMFRI
jgi:hypothetical protein